jgi:hypothetical protein
VYGVDIVRAAVLAVRATKATARGALLAMLVYLRGLEIVAANKGVTGKGGRLERRRRWGEGGAVDG